MATDNAKNAVLGFATNLSSERIEVFAKTLRQVYSSQECDLIIYTNEVNDELCHLAEKYSISFMYTPNNYSGAISKVSKALNRIIIHSTKTLAKNTRQVASFKIIFNELYPLLLKLWHHPHFVRWLSYKDFLHTHKNYEKLFLSDIKDVAFQAPFFESLDNFSLHFFEQDQYYGPNNWDTRWYREAYGEEELKKLEGKPALCIGTIMGDFKGIEFFVNLVCEEILERPFGRIEQTIFNKLYYSHKFALVSVKVHKNAEGPLTTLSDDCTQRYFEIKPEGLVGMNGQLLPVIHMYDRFDNTFTYFSEVMGCKMRKSALLGFDKK